MIQLYYAFNELVVIYGGVFYRPHEKPVGLSLRLGRTDLAADFKLTSQGVQLFPLIDGRLDSLHRLQSTVEQRILQLIELSFVEALQRRFEGTAHSAAEPVVEALHRSD